MRKFKSNEAGASCLGLVGFSAPYQYGFLNAQVPNSVSIVFVLSLMGYSGRANSSNLQRRHIFCCMGSRANPKYGYDATACRMQQLNEAQSANAPSINTHY
jgi:hypothetical protein